MEYCRASSKEVKSCLSIVLKYPDACGLYWQSPNYHIPAKRHSIIANATLLVLDIKQYQQEHNISQTPENQQWMGLAFMCVLHHLPCSCKHSQCF